MPKQPSKNPPEIRKPLRTALVAAFVCAVLVLVALPLIQYMVIDPPKDPGPEVDTRTITPPDMVDPPEPPDPDPPDPKIADLKEPPPLPTIDQIAVTIDPNLRGIDGADWTVVIDGTAGQGHLDDIVHRLEDLTHPPRPLSQRAPNYPPELRRTGISGNVWVGFVVRADGTTSNVVILKSDHPGFEEPAIGAVRRWTFEPGEKDGRPVATQVRRQITFSHSR